MLDPIQTLKEYISYASVSADPSYKEGMQGACNFVTRHLKALNFEVDVVETPLHPIILATRTGNPDAPHIVLYDHYDVQPADPFNLWTSPPFEAEVRGDRIYGRGSADNKGPFIVQLAALSQILEKDPDFPLNITFLIEGEEEVGSPSFPAFLEKYRERLQEADCILLSDTGSSSPEQVVITTGLRGLVALEIHFVGPKTDLHSGAYGGAIYNPIQALTEICASLHDENGRVNVEGFYDEVFEVLPWEREQLQQFSEKVPDIGNSVGVTECYHQKNITPTEACRVQPTLEINGIGGGYQGQGHKTIIPSTAFAKITCRLVPDQNPKRICELLVNTIKERCPKGISVQFKNIEGAGAPYWVIPPSAPNTPEDQPEGLRATFEAVDAAVESVFGKKPLYLREGGSIPIIRQIKEATGLDSVLLGLYTVDDNLHAPDESFHLTMMNKGIEVYKEALRSLVNRS